MYSQCPECLTRFRVTAAALRAAHGTVRCGRCGSAFDALPRLTDTVPDDSDSPAASGEMLAPDVVGVDGPARPWSGDHPHAAGTGDDAAAGMEFHFSADDIEHVFIDAQDWQKRFPSATVDRIVTGDATLVLQQPANDDGDETGAAIDESDATAPNAGPPVVVHETETIEDITLEGERIVIEGLPAFDDDLREILREGEPADDAIRLPGGAPPPVDLDSTDRFEVLRNVPDSAYPEFADDEAGQEPDAHAAVAEVAPIASPPPAEPAVEAAPEPTEPAIEATPESTEPAIEAAPEPTEPAIEAAPEPTEPAAVPHRLRQRDAADWLDKDEDDEAANEESKTLAWGAGALLLAVLFCAQLTHQYREPLAHSSTVGPAVRSLYAQFGRPLAPNWDLATFELRRSGTHESPSATAGAMTVRANLRNGADFAQPFPLLRLELEDRFGGTVARRDFDPREYLKDPAQASRLLAPGATTDAELDVVEAGGDAVGYRLDVCMRDATGAVRCAQPADGSVPQ